MGVAVVLINDSQIAYQGYFGLADSSRQIPITENTYYRVASISKTIASIAVMQLVEQGKLDLDSNVSKYLNWDLIHPLYPDKEITLRHFLNHRSGVRDGQGYGKFLSDMVSEKLDIRALFQKDGAYFTDDLFATEPGAYFAYSNCVWGIVASIVEKVSGKRFDKYCRDHILLPLGLNSSFNVLDLVDIDQLAVLYRYKEGQWVPQTDHYLGKPPEPRHYPGYQLGHNGLLCSPQGGLRSSAKDLATIATMLMNGGTLGNVKILSPVSVAQMLENHWTFEKDNGDTWNRFFLSYGLGVHRITNQDTSDIIFPDRKMFGHPGIAYGLLSDMYFDPKTKSGIVFITNGSKHAFDYGAHTSFYQVEEDVFNAVYPLISNLE